MHTKCTYTDRIEIKNKKLTRIINAQWKEKEMDVIKQTEDNKEYGRHVYYNKMAGYGIVFKDEYISKSWSAYNYDFVSKVQPYYLYDKEVYLYCGNKPTEKDIQTVIEKYPEFRYVVKKHKFQSNYELIKAVYYWKIDHNFELLIQNNLNALAYTDAFYKLTQNKKKQIVNYCMNNRKLVTGCCYNEILSMVKQNVRKEDVSDFFKARSLNLTLEEFRYVRKNEISEADYLDYKRKLKKTCHSMKDNYWHFPNDFKARVNKIEEEMKNAELLRLSKIEKQYFNTISKFIEMKANYGDMEIYIPSTVEDIREQAKVLNQCLISNDYIGKVIKKQCVLVFMKKNNQPYATIEIRENNIIGQFYKNEKSTQMNPTEEDKKLFNQWLEDKPLLLAA